MEVRTPENKSEQWMRQLHGSCEVEKPKNIFGGGNFSDVLFLPEDCF